jgi:hypothetical protein
MFWVIFVSTMMIVIGWKALELAFHLLSGQYVIDERLRRYARR